jgi:hypothetical protein
LIAACSGRNELWLDAFFSRLTNAAPAPMTEPLRTGVSQSI